MIENQPLCQPAKQTVDRHQFLVELMTATQPLYDPSEITATIARKLGEYLHCNRCAYAEVDKDENHFDLLGDYTHGVPSIVGRYALSDFGDEVLRLNRQNKVYVVHDTDNDPQVTSADLAAYRATQIRAVISVPLCKQGKFVAGMAVHQATPRTWTAEEIELVSFVVGLCWESIERARVTKDLRKKEDHLRFAMEGAGIGTWELDLTTGLGEWSAEAVRLINSTRSQFTAEDWFEAIHPDDRTRVLNAWNLAITTDGPYEVEFRAACPSADGSEKWLLSRGKVERNSDKEATRCAGVLLDITPHRRIENELRKNQTLLNAVTETAPDPVFAKDLNGRMLIANAATVNAIGKPKQEIIGRNESEWMDNPEQAAIIQANDQRIIKTGQAEVVEEEMQTPMGVRIFSGRKAPLKNAAGETIGLVGVSHDVTELKAIEKALRNSETESKRIADNLSLALKVSHSGYFEWTVKDNRNFWSDELLGLYGIKREEFGGTSEDWLASLVPEDREKGMAALQTSLKTGDFAFEFRIIRKDTGEVRWMDGRGHVFFNEQGQPERMVGINVDITERKTAEQALRESEERFNLAIQGSNDGIWDWDIASGTLYWSDRLKEQLGYSPDFTPSYESWRQSVHPDDQEKVFNAIQDHLDGKTDFYHLVFRDREVNGKWNWVFARGLALRDQNGKPHRMAGTRTDITQQKELEEQLKEALNRAENANQAKTEFLANMSHEIRTPMNAVVGLANLLGMDRALSVKQKEMISTLQLSAQSLLQLINDLLDIAKIETNQIELEFIPFMLEELFHEVMGLSSVKAQEKGIYLNCLDSSILKQQFVGDPLRLRQILVNLVSNAIKFTEKGGVEISVTTSPLAKTDACYLHICVKDTGIGIAEDKLCGIFEKFTQADSSITRKYGGTGLGLAISKNLAEIMGGNITVKSILGNGSEFTLHVPLKLADKKNSGLHTPPPPAENRAMIDNIGHVLLVEDYKPNILVASHLLENLGYSCDIASNGKEALAKLNNNRQYAAVLMDIQMPDMDGLDATRNIRKEEAEKGYAKLPIIAMTAHALHGDRDRCLQAGMDEYISKPFQPSQLRDVLERCRIKEDMLDA